MGSVVQPAQFMLPYVSVVVPFRNASAWLGDCLASLRCQQQVNLELLAVDDGSTDRSSDLVLSLSQGAPWQLRLLQSGGRGVSEARNLGWRTAAAELVAFLDADDLAYPGRLAEQAALLIDAPHLDHCLCGWQRLSVSGQPLVDVRPWLDGAGFSHELALSHKAVLPSAWMLRRSALDRLGGFDPLLDQAEDVDLLLRLAASGSEGAWLERVACGYRIHPAGASRQLSNQARGLLYVIERHLSRSHEPAIPAALAFQVRYSTRAWLGWQAWAGGEPDRAQELWTTALGLSPLPPALTWVHLLESVERSALAQGRGDEAALLMADPLWTRLERLWCRRMFSSRPLPYQDGALPESVWREVLASATNQALLRWRSNLIAQLGPHPSQSPWWPERLRQGLVPVDVLRPLRHRLLSWIEQLLSWQPDDPPQGGESLRMELAALLFTWAVLVWPETRNVAYARLEQSVAIWPNRQSLLALSRLQRVNSPAGAAGLLQLASRLPPLAAPLPELPSSLAYWERPAHRLDSCQGPQCSACINADLKDWPVEALAAGLVRWHAPVADQAKLQIELDAPLAVRELAWGRAWLRSPLTNLWQSNHAVAVASADGAPILDLCRRYPQPWLSCNQPAADPEPAPASAPLRLDSAVLAVADLSAETYYHWLLEHLPRLGLALEALAADPDLPRLLIWHNGGHGALVAEALQNRLGLPAERLIDARLHPHIQASRLLVPDFPSPFGWPAAKVQRWLRRFLLGDAAFTPPNPGGPRLWLQRGDVKGRRSVWGEQETLAQVAERWQLTVVNPAQLTLLEQANLLAKASVVISAHGSALANLVFAAPGTRVLELHQPRYAPPYFHSIAQYGRLNLFRSVQPSVAPELLRDLFYEGPGLEPIQLEPSLVEAALIEMLKVESSGGGGVLTR